MIERDEFMALYGRPRQAVASAPGRVNLIGDHTDYNGGFVLPTALPQRTQVQLARRDDRRVRAASAQRPGVLDYELGAEARAGSWLDYVQGITAALLADARPITGFDLHIDSTVPVGAGLSSSAALEVALLRGLRDLFSLALDDDAVAALAHRAEAEFVGVPVGIMDQIACSRGDPGIALFIDTRTRIVEPIPLPPDLGLVVIDSGLPHDLASNNYRVRRGECEQAAAALGVEQLRDVAGDDPRIATLPDPLPRRVRHVVGENQRVLDAARALAAGDLARLGRLFDESHRSMRDDFEVSLPEIDLLVALAQADEAMFGARLTGGGFGGAVVAITESARAARVAGDVAAAYHAKTSRRPMIVLPSLRASATRPKDVES
ncbi:galactokinase [Nannocystis sp. SCPEA4]|uniref:galactokinase n=1 Tax=Nannocystis sp. SCPEA4 TaxID=2996787 RepID=UPI00226E3EF4|nr:galactokinase [Nannocystis sp. SCPEA4]MCY1058191.1 galactokinase [Nannocystis sp. SCPEA4]